MHPDEDRLGRQLAEGLIDYAKQHLPMSSGPEAEQVKRIVLMAHRHLGAWLADRPLMDARTADGIELAIQAVRESETTGHLGVRDPDPAVAWPRV